MTIFMLQAEVYDGDDYYGRETYRDELAEEWGYFTSYEKAQAWIDKQVEKARVRHDELVKKVEQQVADWQAEKDKHDASMSEVTALAKEKGVKVVSYNFDKPKPKTPKFTPPKWEIVEVYANEDYETV